MTFLADENFPRPAVEALRQAGFDVLWIAEANPGAPDDEVLAVCISTGRVLLRFDKDFGELAYRRGRSAPYGIVLFRVTPQSPDEIATMALSAMQSQQSWTGHFSVVTRQRIECVPCPRSVSTPPDQVTPALPAPPSLAPA
jgi:predicted nuclease of predicted toxin-antitoxin system